MEGRAYWAIVLLVVALAVTYVACLFVGQSSMTAKDVIDSLLGGGSWGDHYNVFVLRMPRIACAAIVGAGLSVAGMAMQAMFKNPMASPSILGLSSGASFGASLAIAFGFGAFAGSFSIPIMAFVFCFLTLLMVYGLAVTRYGTPVTLLLLSGVAVGAFFGGMTSFIQYVVEPDILQGVVYWTMGSFNRCHWDSFWIVLIVVGIGVAMICTRLRELNLISLGEDQAQTLGVNVKRTRIILLIGTSLAVGGSVAVSGPTHMPCYRRAEPQVHGTAMHPGRGGVHDDHGRGLQQHLLHGGASGRNFDIASRSAVLRIHHEEEEERDLGVNRCA